MVMNSANPEDIVVVYHAGCNDGFTAAWIVAKYYHLTDDQLIPAAYGHEPSWDRLYDKHVFIVDFSFPRETLIKLDKQARSLLVIDHHITAQKDLEGLFFCHFDQTRCGASLTWKIFHLDKPVPKLVQYVEDRDLWKWQLPESKLVSSVIETFCQELYHWDRLSYWLEEDITSVINAGEHIEDYKNSILHRILKNQIIVSIDGYEVPIVNSPILQSELGDIMRKEKPFAAVYYYNGDTQEYIVSLRSDDNGIDVSQLAKKFGGGGHKRAAGFNMTIDPIKEFLSY